MTGSEMIVALQDPAVRDGVQRALGLPTEPVAIALRELAAAQARTDATVKELAAAQARTDATVKELAAAQARTDATVKELAAEVKELAAAQARTDATVKELAAEVKELAAAQARTDRSVADLRKEVGKLSDNVGFGLEELAALVLPGALERDDGVQAGRFVRRFFQTEVGDEEVDLYAEASRQGSSVVVVGEVKSRIYAGDVQKFSAKLARLAPGLPAEPFAVMFGFVVHPAAQQMAQRLGVRVLASRPSI
jgi:hypothetical protein